MELAAQIRQQRNRMGWSQEELAEKAFVSRQTISNWENDKSYPDIQSLLLLSTLFDVSLDQLVKGDVETMKEQTGQNDVKKFKRMSVTYTFLILVMLVSAIPLFRYAGVVGMVVWMMIVFVMIGYGYYIERWKDKRNLQTYREILAFLSGKAIDEIRSERQSKKEFVVKLLIGAVFGVVFAVLFDRGSSLLFEWLF